MRHRAIAYTLAYPLPSRAVCARVSARVCVPVCVCARACARACARVPAHMRVPERKRLRGRSAYARSDCPSRISNPKLALGYSLPIH